MLQNGNVFYVLTFVSESMRCVREGVCMRLHGYGVRESGSCLKKTDRGGSWVVLRR